MHKQICRKKIFFERMARIWKDNLYTSLDSRQRLDSLIDKFQIKEKENVLDVGCGTGIICKRLLSLGRLKGHIIGCDYSLAMLKNVTRVSEDKVDLVCCDAHYLPFPELYFNKVILFSCFPHFDHKNKVIEEVARVLKPSGVMFIAHLLSREEMTIVHRQADSSVLHDTMPDFEQLETTLNSHQMFISNYIDRKGLYFLRAEKTSR